MPIFSQFGEIVWQRLFNIARILQTTALKFIDIQLGQTSNLGRVEPINWIRPKSNFNKFYPERGSICIIILCNDVNATRAVIGRYPWSIRVQIHGWRHGKLVFFVLFNMARGFENVCEIISDWGKWKLRKKFSRSYLQRRKMEKRRPKKLLTTWQCLNYKKSSQQLPSCVFATRDSLFCKMSLLLFFFEQEKTVKNFSKKLYTSKIKKKLRWKVGFGT